MLKKGRITPACAGKTGQARHHPCEAKDHPRVCGENKIDVTLRYRDQGSPPRVRGKLRCKGFDYVVGRITPACAGKTTIVILVTCCKGDHPRVCGENRMAKFPKKYETGSPPRVRGKPINSFIISTRSGITPACAGKTACTNALHVLSQDHPRVCGENYI